MLWSGAQSKRKILRKTHAFLLLPVLCLALGAGGGILFCALGAPALEPGLFRMDPAAAAGGFFAAAARCARFPAFLFLVSFGSFAPFCSCAAMFVRGFLLSYALCSLGAVLGGSGFLCALAMELVPGIALLPYAVMLAGWAISRRARVLDRQAAAVAITTIGIVLIAAALDCVVTPWLTGFFSFA